MYISPIKVKWTTLLSKTSPLFGKDLSEISGAEKGHMASLVAFAELLLAATTSPILFPISQQTFPYWHRFAGACFQERMSNSFPLIYDFLLRQLPVCGI